MKLKYVYLFISFMSVVFANLLDMSCILAFIAFISLIGFTLETKWELENLK